MKTNVWILSHYTGGTCFSGGGRHFWISRFLKEQGYNPTIFTCNIKHGNGDKYLDIGGIWRVVQSEHSQVPYVFVESIAYKNNGIKRIGNMYGFYKNVQIAAKEYAQKYGKPDIIYASSVHPLTLVAGIKLATFFGVKCICEVRDLWPESLVAYGQLKNKFITNILYYFEKRIYVKADKIIMTWPGGYDYIKDRKWEKDIPQNKVVHISNGVDLEQYKKNIKKYPYSDEELDNEFVKKIIYTGSIREVNNLGLIVDAAHILYKRKVNGFKILVYGSGTERDSLKKRVEELKLDNISFVGSVPKECVPAVLDKAYITLLHNSSTSLDKYGQSQNKFFEYLAAGKPILMTYSVGYSICKANNCGFEVDKQNPESIADAIEKIVRLSDEEYEVYGHNAEKTADMYDFKNLTKKMIDVIEQL